MFFSATNYDSRARGRCFPRDARAQPDLSSEEGQAAVSHPSTTSSTSPFSCGPTLWWREADFLSSSPRSFPRKVFSHLEVAEGQFCRGDLWLCQALNTAPRSSGRYHRSDPQRAITAEEQRDWGDQDMKLVSLAYSLIKMISSWRTHQKCSEGSLWRC